MSDESFFSISIIKSISVAFIIDFSFGDISLGILCFVFAIHWKGKFGFEFVNELF